MPGSAAGIRSFFTSSLPVSRVFVIVQTMSSPVVDLDGQRPASSAGWRHDPWFALAVSMQRIDFW